RLLDRDTRRQLGHDGNELDADRARGKRLGIDAGERHPELARRPRGSERPRHRPHDVVGLAVEANGSPDNRLVAAEDSLPETIAQERNAIPARRLLLRGERAPEEGLDAEERKERGGNALGLDPERLGAPREGEAPGLI